jgi:hypothetical protein
VIRCRHPRGPQGGLALAGSAALGSALLLALLLPAGGSAAAPSGPAGSWSEGARTAPALLPASDTFGDPGVRALVERARAARGRETAGLESFHGRMWERVYAGVDARGFRRERGIFQEERSAFVRWTAEGDRWIRWEGARRDVPIVGVSSATHEGQARQLARQLGESIQPWALGFEPGSDRLVFGQGNWALHPLADTAGYHYRYHSGDTLRITLPSEGRMVTLAEVRVEPRRAEFRLLAASLWFDVESGALVRAVYRPARPFDLSLDGGPDSDDVPRFLRPVRAEIRVVSVDHGFFDFQWWIPRRYLFEGEATVGRFARFPLSVEWTLDDLDVNQPLPDELDPEQIPEGWRTSTVRVARRAEGDSANVVRIVPPAGELADGPRIGAAPTPDRVSFTPGELRELEGRLGRLLPSPGARRPTFHWGLEEGLTRFNRVEGLATGAGASMLLPGSRTLRGEVRAGTHAVVPTGGLTLSWGPVGRAGEVALEHRLVGSSEWHAPLGLGASLANLVNGEGPTPYHRAAGVRLRMERTGSLWRGHLEGFGEAQRSAEAGTTFHLRRLLNSDRGTPDVLPALEGEWAGVRGEHRWQSGIDSRRLRAFTRLLAEGAGGTTAYARGSATMGVVAPLFPGWEVGVEGGAGSHVGVLPLQRAYFPGGASGYRPSEVGSWGGGSYLLGRAELGRGTPAGRIVLFADALRLRELPGVPTIPFGADLDAPEAAGPWTPWAWGGGIGLSLLDGFLRADFARSVEPRSGWRLLLYLDGIF